MEELTKEQVMELHGEDLVAYVNGWLAKEVSVTKLAEQVGFRKGTILDRLKRAKYFYNGEYNAYMKPLTSEAPDPAFIAEGEAEYMRILSEAYNDESKADFYSFVRQLDAVKVTLKNGDNTIVLDKDSPIAELFYN